MVSSLLLPAIGLYNLPIVSIVVPFWGYLFRILNIKLVKPKKGTTMETTGSDQGPYKHTNRADT